MSRYGGGGGGYRDDRYRDDRRRSVDVQVEERERDIYGPGFRERDFDFRERDTYAGGYDRRETKETSLVPVRQERIIERDLYEVPPEPEPIIPIREIEVDNTIKVTEHEHEHVHHHNHIHIDHAAVHIVSAEPPTVIEQRPRERERKEEVFERETLTQIRERRYGDKWNATGKLTLERGFKERDRSAHRGEREEFQERDVKRTVGYGRYRETDEVDVREYKYSSPRSSGMLPTASPRGSGLLGNFSAAQQEGWTVVDVPPGTRRITVDSGPGTTEIKWKTENSIRRKAPNPERRETRGELWTEITKDLVAAEALEEFGYQFEETDNFLYVFDYLHRDQIQDLIELTKDIRRERVREIENTTRYERERSRPRSEHPYYEHDRFTERREFTPYGERDRVTDRREVFYHH